MASGNSFRLPPDLEDLLRKKLTIALGWEKMPVALVEDIDSDSTVVLPQVELNHWHVTKAVEVEALERRNQTDY